MNFIWEIQDSFLLFFTTLWTTFFSNFIFLTAKQSFIIPWIQSLLAAGYAFKKLEFSWRELISYYLQTISHLRVWIMFLGEDLTHFVVKNKSPLLFSLSFQIKFLTLTSAKVPWDLSRLGIYLRSNCK